MSERAWSVSVLASSHLVCVFSNCFQSFWSHLSLSLPSPLALLSAPSIHPSIVPLLLAFIFAVTPVLSIFFFSCPAHPYVHPYVHRCSLTSFLLVRKSSLSSSSSSYSISTFLLLLKILPFATTHFFFFFSSPPPSLQPPSFHLFISYIPSLQHLHLFSLLFCILVVHPPLPLHLLLLDIPLSFSFARMKYPPPHPPLSFINKRAHRIASLGGGRGIYTRVVDGRSNDKRGQEVSERSIVGLFCCYIMSLWWG